MGPRVRQFWVRWLVCFLLAGCQSGAPSGLKLGAQSFGEGCLRTEDCASGLCVRIDQNGGVCTSTCTADAGCPSSDNWACLTSDSSKLDICACRKLAEQEICGNGIDDECNGKVDDCRLCAGLAVPEDDPNHCGACGVACSVSQICQGGKCRCPLSASDACGDNCTTLSKDPQNCGTCGSSCGSERACDAGKCVCKSTTQPDYCSGVGCVSFQSDSNHCGNCKTACSLGQVCQEGACSCAAGPAPDFCDGVGCVDQASNLKNCGKCGHACDDGFVCSAGKCACPVGQTECGGVCVDTKTSNANCGGCDNVCGTAQACSGGTCGCSQFGFSVCGGVCADLDTDVKSCGVCGHGCKDGETCTLGSCQCPSGVYCGDTCMPNADAQNCGSCGNACGAAQRCGSSTCQCQGAGLSACGAACMDLNFDEANCGTCGRQCPLGQTCNWGSCGCTGSQTYCALQGACLDLGSDPAHCGSCDQVCGPSQICSLGACKCPSSNQLFCPAKNQCIDVQSDPLNCGACGNACNPSEICGAGVCKCAAAGQKYCASGNACVDTLSNAQSCGACDKRCNPTEVCSAGACKCAAAGQKYCASSDACIDTLSNPQNCGACDKLCNPTQICQSGSCICPSVTPTYCASASACINLSNDPKNCGSCGKQCPAGTQCSANNCVCNTTGQTLCGSVCHDLKSDVSSCGACNNACPANFSCSAGNCRCQDATPGTPVRLTNSLSDDSRPKVAWDGVHLGVAYRSEDSQGANVRFALLAANGSLVSDVAVTNLTHPQTVTYGPALAWSGSEYGIVWLQRTASTGQGVQPNVMFRRIASSGQPISPEVEIAGLADSALDYPYSNYRSGAGLAWSSSYGGYAVSYLSQTSGTFLVFRRIGATGAAPEPSNKIAVNGNPMDNYPLVAAPDGTWGIASQTPSVSFSLIDADGAHTLPTASISSGTQPALVYDGKAWLTAFAYTPPNESLRTYFVNRGTGANSPSRLLALSSTTDHVDASITMVNGALAIAFTNSPLSQYGTGPFSFSLQRFAIPSSTSSALAPIDNPVEILPTSTLPQPGDMQIAATGKYSLLAVWADNRWGANRELYSRPLDLHSCP